MTRAEATRPRAGCFTHRSLHQRLPFAKRHIGAPAPTGETGATLKGMRRATITIGDDIDQSLDAYLRQQEVAPALTAVVQAALREYLARRGFAAGPRKLRITPAKKDSGVRDASARHDRYLTAE